MPFSGLPGHGMPIVHIHAEKTPIHGKYKYPQKYFQEDLIRIASNTIPCLIKQEWELWSVILASSDSWPQDSHKLGSNLGIDVTEFQITILLLTHCLWEGDWQDVSWEETTCSWGRGLWTTDLRSTKATQARHWVLLLHHKNKQTNQLRMIPVVPALYRWGRQQCNSAGLSFRDPVLKQ